MFARGFGNIHQVFAARAENAEIWDVEGNRYIDEHKPWVMAKEEGREDEVQAVCTQGLNAFRSLVIMLKPVLPALVLNILAVVILAQVLPPSAPARKAA